MMLCWWGRREGNGVPSSFLRPAFLRHTFEDFCRLGRRRDPEHVLLGELPRLRIPAGPYLLRRCLPIVGCPSELVPLWAKQQPVRARPVSIGHPHAPRIENAYI